MSFTTINAYNRAQVPSFSQKKKENKEITLAMAELEKLTGRKPTDKDKATLAINKAMIESGANCEQTYYTLALEQAKKKLQK